MSSDDWSQFFSRMQKDVLLEHLESWNTIEKSKTPCDRDLAEAAIKDAYAQLDLPPPKVAWCRSPLTMALSRAIVETLGSKEVENTNGGPAENGKLGRSFCGPFLKGKMRNEAIIETEDRLLKEVGETCLIALLRVSSESGWRADSIAVDELFGTRRRSLYDRAPTWSFVAVNDGRPNSLASRLVNTFELAIQNEFRRRIVPLANIEEAVEISEQILGWPLSDAELEEVLQYYELRNIGGFVNLLQRTIIESCFGQLDSRFLVLPSFFREHLDFKWHTERAVPLISLARSTGGFLPHENVCWMMEKIQTVHLDDRSRLHNETGPAVEYSGWGVYCWHGVVVDRRTILEPHTLTVKDIESETNLETRRIMITRYGEPRFLEDSGATVVDDDPAYGTLYRKVLARDEPLQMVKVRNSTPEPDGSVRNYHLRVPPTVRTAHEAVAWTFNMNRLEYKPEKET